MEIGSSTPPNHPRMSYDVFLSFRGEDSCKTFVRFLCENLCRLGMRAFMDDKKVLIGDNLSEKLVKAIEESRSFVVVLSELYASSKLCLKELTNIMDHMAETTHWVFPVFYHVDPLDVRRRSGSFKKSFDAHEETAQKFTGEQKEKYLREVQNWKDSMTKIGSMAGLVVTKDRFEGDAIKIIANQMFDMFRPKLVVPESLQEMWPRLGKMKKLLDLESNDVLFVGIVGMGGIGKTTMAKVIYDNIISLEYWNSHCFLCVHEQSIVLLQHQLLSQLLMEKDIKIRDEEDGKEMIKNRLRSRKVLIVLDGVNDKRQLENLAGSPNWFGSQSRVIITTRNRDVLRQPKYKDKIQQYNMDLLSEESASELFCKHAFRGTRPHDENFKHLTEEILGKAKGLPLALIKLGTSLCGQSIDIWEEALRNYDKLVYDNLFSEILKKSYEDLDVDSQNIFLDLACFFNGERVERVKEILELEAAKLHLLVDRCLIDISHEKIQMHFLIFCMSRVIAHEKLATQSRIWLREDIRRVFHEKSGLKYIQGIVDLEEEEELELEAKSFTYMTELKILEISNVQLSEDIEFLSNELRVLKWIDFPLKRFPSTFQPRFLVQLNLPGSNLERLWEGRKHLESLKEIDVSDSKYLVETPDFTYVPNLRRLILRNCSRLFVIHPSINSLDRLVLLDMAGCVNLRRFSSNIRFKNIQTLNFSNSGLEKFPDILTEPQHNVLVINSKIGNLTNLVFLSLKNCTKLSSLPSEIGTLTHLGTLILNGCKKLYQIPPSLGNLESLEELDIGGTSIKSAPKVINNLWNLKILNCERLSSNIWSSLTAIFSDFWSIRDLNLSYCNLVDEDIPDDLYLFTSLEILDLSGNHFVRLSQSLSQLLYLKALYLYECKKLKQLPTLPASLRYVGGLKSMDVLPKSEGSSTSISLSSSPLSNPLIEEVDDLSEQVAETSKLAMLSNPPPMTKVDHLSKQAAENESRPQVDSINKMEQVSHLWCSKLLASNQNLVGMGDQLEKVYNLLDLDRKNDVLFLGILGMGGIGKTSLARIVYDTIANEFESSCFLNISMQSNLISLQHQLLSRLLSEENIKILDKDCGVKMIKSYISGRKVLIVLDDVDGKSQIEKLVGSLDWYSPGSRVIITTRDRKVLHQPAYKDGMLEYNMGLLDDASALQLFCKHAFRRDHPDHNLKDLCDEIVRKLEGLPLAIRVMGSFLYDKDIAIWKETLTELFKVEEDFLSTISERRRKGLALGRCLPYFH